MRLNEFEMLPINAFRPRYGKFGPMTLEGGKDGGGAPAADPNIGIAQRELSKLATEQWEEFKTTIYPDLKAAAATQEARVQGQYETTKKISEQQYAQGEEAYARYKEGAIPAMEKLRADADQYNTEAYQEQLASQAAGDIGQAAQTQREQTAMRQRAYGIDPTSGVAQGQANANSVMQAAASAAAANQTREAAKQVGLQKQANVYNMYAGLPAQANQSTALGLNASGQGVNAGQSTFTNQMGISGAQNAAAGTAMSGWGQVGSLGVQKYQADVGAYNAQQANEGAMWGGLGSAIGSGAALYMKSGGSDIAIKQDIQRVGRLNNGLSLFKYQYKPEYRDTWGHGFHVGVMAQEVEQVIPDAVSVHTDGYKMVDYGKVLNHGI
jgi:hypothetical protein